VIVTTTPEIAGKTIVEYKGIVFGEVLTRMKMGWTTAGVIAEYEAEMIKAKRAAINKMIDSAAKIAANAVVGVDFDFQSISQGIYISATGTAVVVA